MPSTSQNATLSIRNANPSQLNATGNSLSQAGSSGTDISTTMNMSRTINGLDFGIYNSYTDLSHSQIVDLSGYHIPGWTLYKAVIDATMIEAAPERVSLNVDATTYIRIRNDTGGTDLTTDVLYQEFFKIH